MNGYGLEFLIRFEVITFFILVLYIYIYIEYTQIYIYIYLYIFIYIYIYMFIYLYNRMYYINNIMYDIPTVDT